MLNYIKYFLVNKKAEASLLVKILRTLVIILIAGFLMYRVLSPLLG